jgi:hypothetical protein
MLEEPNICSWLLGYMQYVLLVDTPCSVKVYDPKRSLMFAWLFNIVSDNDTKNFGSGIRIITR